MFKAFKYELLILALAFCALQYGRSHVEKRAFLQSDLGEEVSSIDNTLLDTTQLKATTEEPSILTINQHLYLGVSLKPAYLLNSNASKGVGFSV